jgi:hypothetical protein
MSVSGDRARSVCANRLSHGFIDRSMRDRFDQGLVVIHADGRYRAINRRYEQF